jgi:hypothetical protein
LFRGDENGGVPVADLVAAGQFQRNERLTSSVASNSSARFIFATLPGLVSAA